MTKNSDNKNIEEDVGEIPSAPLIIHKQYLKDLSFENPNAPLSLVPANKRPAMDMNILLDIQRLENEEHEFFYEVILTLTANAKRDDNTLFLIEVVYGATVSIHDLKPGQHHPLLFVEVPQLIFPFARQILAASSQAGGYTPLQVAPVDFRAMYLKRFANGLPQNSGEEKAKISK